MNINESGQCAIVDEKLPIGVLLYSELLKYKKFYNEIPESILQFDSEHEDENNAENCILMKNTTSDAVNFRQQHPVLKKIKNFDKITADIKWALNKVSDDNIDAIVEDICKITNITNASVINELTYQIIEKVSMEQNFLQVYAKMCSKLQYKIKCDEDSETFIFKIREICKGTFDKYIKIGNIKNINEEIKFDKKEINLMNNEDVLDKMKITNIVKFIGHLYNIKIFRISAIDYCIRKLLNDVFDLMYCSDLIIVLIKCVETSYTKENKIQFQKYIQSIQIILQNEKLQKRDKFIIMNFIDEYMKKK
jgi:hypothetical protein